MREGVEVKTNLIGNSKYNINSLTARWWFIALVPLIFFFSPPIVQKNGFPITDFSKSFETIGYIGANNFTGYFAKFSPLMNIIALLVIVFVFVFKNKFNKVFSIYVALLMIFYGITQNTSYTDKFGIGIITSSYILLPILSGVWIWEAFAGKTDFSVKPKINFYTISAFCFALFAFWNPINSELMPDFNPVYLLTNGGNSMFCTMTPMILAVLFFFYPNINTAVLRVTGLSGATIGFIQLVMHLGIFVKTNWWIGVLHIPVFLLSLASIIVSFKADKLK